MRSAVAIAALAVACGGRQRDQIAREAQAFDCRKRIASYVATHHLAGDELGVQMDCAEAGPRIKRWKMDKHGTRQEDAHGLTPGQFDRVWKEIEGTGWQYLHDCENGTGEKVDPVYLFDIKDDTTARSFQCQSQAMPYPYNDIVDPLDAAAREGRHQLGDDEPAEMKALEHKDKQR